MINLLPPEIKEAHTYGRRNVSMLGNISALVLTALLTAGVMTVSLSFVGSDQAVLQDSIEQSEQQIAKLETEVSAVEEAATRLETAKKISDSSINFSELIPSIAAVLPQGVVLNGLSLTGGTEDPLKLDVDLTNAELASVLIRNLVESELFEAADITSLSPKGTAGVEGSETAESKYRYGASVTASFVKNKDTKKQVTPTETTP